MNQKNEHSLSLDNPEDFLQALKIVGTLICNMFGKDCEVAISNLDSEEKRVVWIQNGHVSGRQVGSPISENEEAIERMKSQTKGLYMNYKKSLGLGKKEIKSSTAIFLVNGRTFSFCVNYDCSLEKEVLYRLQSFTSMLPNQLDEGEFIDANEDIIRKLTEDELVLLSTPASKLSRKQRVEIVKTLEKKGVFNRRNSVPIVAEVLEVSRYTIYNDLKEE